MRRKISHDRDESDHDDKTKSAKMMKRIIILIAIVAVVVLPAACMRYNALKMADAHVAVRRTG